MKRTIRLLLTSAFAALIVAPAFAAEKKKLLVVTVTYGFRHSSIPTAEKVLAKIADESGAFTVDFVRQPPDEPKKPDPKKYEGRKDKPADSADSVINEPSTYEEAVAAYDAEKRMYDARKKAALAKLKPERLEQYDGVIFANTTGELPLPDKEGFIKWIEDGHAFIGMHSASDTFHQFKPYIEMLGGEFETHHAQVPAELIKMDKAHPATADLPDPWNIKMEEMYLIKSYDRKKVRDLWAMKHHPNDKAKEGHYPVAWAKMAGKGKVFYTSLGHREDVWEHPDFQKHILGGIKWALGLAEGSAEPQEK